MCKGNAVVSGAVSSRDQPQSSHVTTLRLRRFACRKDAITAWTVAHEAAALPIEVLAVERFRRSTFIPVSNGPRRTARELLEAYKTKYVGNKTTPSSSRACLPLSRPSSRTSRKLPPATCTWFTWPSSCGSACRRSCARAHRACGTVCRILTRFFSQPPQPNGARKPSSPSRWFTGAMATEPCGAAAVTSPWSNAKSSCSSESIHAGLHGFHRNHEHRSSNVHVGQKNCIPLLMEPKVLWRFRLGLLTVVGTSERHLLMGLWRSMTYPGSQCPH